MKANTNPDYLVNKASSYLWLGLGIVSLCGAIFCGAWWHLFTAAICALFYAMFKHDADVLKEKK